MSKKTLPPHPIEVGACAEVLAPAEWAALEQFRDARRSYSKRTNPQTGTPFVDGEGYSATQFETLCALRAELEVAVLDRLRRDELTVTGILSVVDESGRLSEAPAPRAPIDKNILARGRMALEWSELTCGKHTFIGVEVSKPLTQVQFQILMRYVDLYPDPERPPRTADEKIAIEISEKGNLALSTVETYFKRMGGKKAHRRHHQTVAHLR